MTAGGSPSGRPGFLSDVVVELGFAARETVDRAVEQSRVDGRSPEAILVANGEVSEEQIAEAIAERNDLPYVDLANYAIDDGAVSLIDPDTAHRYRAMPIAFDKDGALIVALADPLDALAVSDIGVIAKCEVRPAVTTRSGLEQLLAALPGGARKRPDGESGDDPNGEPGAWRLSPSISIPNPDDPEDGDRAEPEDEGGRLPPVLRLSEDSAEPEQAEAEPEEDGPEDEPELEPESAEPAGEQLAHSLEAAAEQVESLAARIQKLERKARELKAQRDSYKAERDKLREATTDADAAREQERERHLDRESQVRDAVGRAGDSTEALTAGLEQVSEALDKARAAAEQIDAIHRELAAQPDTPE